MRSLRVTTALTEISDNGTKSDLPLYQNDLKFGIGVLKQFIIIDNSIVDTQVTPVVITPPTKTTGVFIRATYEKDYLEDNIEKGDPALIQVDFNNSGNFLTASAFNLENFNPTEIAIKATGTKLIRVERTISAE